MFRRSKSHAPHRPHRAPLSDSMPSCTPVLAGCFSSLASKCTSANPARPSAAQCRAQPPLPLDAVPRRPPAGIVSLATQSPSNHARATDMERPPGLLLLASHAAAAQFGKPLPCPHFGLHSQVSQVGAPSPLTLPVPAKQVYASAARLPPHLVNALYATSIRDLSPRELWVPLLRLASSHPLHAPIHHPSIATVQIYGL